MHLGWGVPRTNDSRGFWIPGQEVTTLAGACLLVQYWTCSWILQDVPALLRVFLEKVTCTCCCRVIRHNALWMHWERCRLTSFQFVVFCFVSDWTDVRWEIQMYAVMYCSFLNNQFMINEINIVLTLHLLKFLHIHLWFEELWMNRMFVMYGPLALRIEL